LEIDSQNRRKLSGGFFVPCENFITTRLTDGKPLIQLGEP